MNQDRQAIAEAGAALKTEIDNILGELPTAGFGSSYSDAAFLQRFVDRSMQHLIPRVEAMIVAIQMASCMNEPGDLADFDLIDVMRDRITDGFHAEQERVRLIASELHLEAAE